MARRVLARRGMGIARLRYSMMQAVESVLGTRYQEWAWRWRHLYRPNWVASYESTLNHPHRKVLAERIVSYNPASVLEVGANVGANLKVLQSLLPRANLVGVDINPVAVVEGRRWTGLPMFESRADDLGMFFSQSFDVVFSDATLICIGPDKIEAVIHEMKRVAKKAIVLCEFQGDHEFYYDGHWVRNYQKYFPSAILTKIPPELWGGSWAKYGYIVEETEGFSASILV